MTVPQPSRRNRTLIAGLVAVVAVAYVVRLAAIMPHYGTDFDPIRYAARLVLHGRNPYDVIGPGREVFWEYRLLYPMPAALIAMPLLLVPIVGARAMFVALTSGALAFVSTRRSWVPACVFLSASWWFAVGVAQWSPGLLAAASVPWLGFLIAAKPNIGLAIMATAQTRRALAILAGTALAITLLSFLIMPGWFGSWRDAVRETPHIRPLATAWQHGGPLLTLAALRWRHPGARMLLTLALVPMNPGLYEGVLLFWIPTTVIEGMILALGSWLVEPMSTSRFVTVAGFGATGQAMLVCMYLPALVMVLRRPNEGPALQWPTHRQAVA